MNALFNSYREFLREQRCFINKRGVIDWTKVTALLGVAKQFEANCISEMKVRFRDRKKAREHETVFDEEKEEIDNSEIDKFEVKDSKIV